jgi:hypothetical protein
MSTGVGGTFLHGSSFIRKGDTGGDVACDAIGMVSDLFIERVAGGGAYRRRTSADVAADIPQTRLYKLFTLRSLVEFN